MVFCRSFDYPLGVLKLFLYEALIHTLIHLTARQSNEQKKKKEKETLHSPFDINVVLFSKKLRTTE
jgi:hypothetical protein